MTGYITVDSRSERYARRVVVEDHIAAFAMKISAIERAIKENHDARLLERNESPSDLNRAVALKVLR